MKGGVGTLNTSPAPGAARVNHSRRICEKKYSFAPGFDSPGGQEFPLAEWFFSYLYLHFVFKLWFSKYLLYL
jgi:hypothetical protein